MNVESFEPEHPYARYGLAVALFHARRYSTQGMEEKELADILAAAIERGLEGFRMETPDSPETVDLLRYDAIPLDTLRREKSLVQSAGLAMRGVYLFPSVVTTDGDAAGTFDSSEEILRALRTKGLDSRWVLKRSFAPTTAKVNNSRPTPSEPKCSLAEAACTAIATLTPLKPAAWVGQRNTAVVPDLPLADLREFVTLFAEMVSSRTGRALMETKLRKRAPEPKPETPGKRATGRRKKAPEAAPRSTFARPRVHNGNYPHAPYDAAAFGAAGVLAAIGKWSEEANIIERGRQVLESLCPPDRPGRPLYVVSYDRVFQEQFSHHVVGLAQAGKLSEILVALARDTVLYSELESARPRYDTPAYRLFYQMANRFLQQFSPATFRDLLAARGEYAPAIEPLFKEYFMNAIPTRIPWETVRSARALGQHLNLTAYNVAKAELSKSTAGTNAGVSATMPNARTEGPRKPDQDDKLRKAKAKILVEFESAVMSAKTPADMLHRVSTRAGRLLQQDLPAEAAAFMDACATGDLDFQSAQYLLIAYLRLRATPRKEGGATEPGGSAFRNGGDGAGADDPYLADEDEASAFE